jgi:hypothetical protein
MVPASSGLVRPIARLMKNPIVITITQTVPKMSIRINAAP